MVTVEKIDTQLKFDMGKKYCEVCSYTDMCLPLLCNSSSLVTREGKGRT